MYYKCTRDLWSIVFPNLRKFTKDEIYESIGKDVYINNQNKEDDVRWEGWQLYFVPFEIDISEITEILEQELELA